MQIKRIWFVSHYSMPPEYEMRIKTQMYAHYLGQLGVDCTIFAASTIHNTDINLIKGKERYIERQYDDLKFVHIRCSNYSKTGVKRILNMKQFEFRFNRIAERFMPPDVIVADAYCLNYRGIYKYCKRHGIPFIVDVRDLWPQSIVEYLHYTEKNLVIRIMYNMEKNMYINADAIIFSIDGGYDYIKDRKLEKKVPREKVYFINNGVDLDEFRSNSQKYIVDDRDLADPYLFKVVYVGSIRKVNNLGLLLDAAKEVKNRKIRFLIWGAGDELEQLQARAIREKIDNVVFKGYIDKRYVAYITQQADLNLVHNNPSEVFKYGISFNKLFDYMASGKPTLSTFPCKYNPAVYEGTGVDVQSPTPQEIAKTIDRLSEEDLSVYRKNAEIAAEKYNYKTLSMRLYEIITNIKQQQFSSNSTLV